jgi:UDP-N-acetylmuramate dehydrogenase
VHIDPATCGYGYRTSRFKTEWKGRYIITAVTYRLSREPRPVLDYGGIRKALEGKTLTPLVIRDTIIGIRREKLPDPAVTGSAGSFFCNPVVPEEVFRRIEGNPPHYEVEGGIKVPAAWLIEQCGFKGARLGGAQVYPRQPLVIVNATGEASPQEIIGLEKQVIDAVREKFGITLHPEVEHV